jgi:2-oxoisovalerate dehydrogenase E1 component beta subunit
MAVKTLLEAIREALFEEMARDERVVVLGEDVGVNGGVFRVTEGLLDAFGEERVMDTPLAELGIIGVSIGLALNGMRPVAEIQFADFIYPAMDQLVSEAAFMHYRTNGDYTCPLVVRSPCGGGVHGALYHSQCVEGFFFRVPGLKVVMPYTPYDAKGLLKAAIRDDNPVLFFEHKRAYRMVRGEVPEEDYIVPIGKASLLRPGSDLTLVTYGLMAHYALEAAEIASREGISIEVLDLRSLAPLDKEAILTSVRKTGKVLIVHEENLTGGVGAEVAAIVAREAFDHLDGPITRVASPDVPTFPYSPPLEEFCLPNTEKILQAVRELAAY